MKNMKQLSLLEYARLLGPSQSDVEHIEQIAADTIAELDESSPVDLEVVASYRGIAEIRVVEMPMAGCLAPERDKMVMLLRSDDSRRRRRFTGFHEIGHSFQPGYRSRRHFRCPSASALPRAGGDPEALSDAAAAALLLPAALIAPEVLQGDFGLETICGLADRYDASVHATAYRFQRYWPEPSLLLALEEGLRKSEREKPDAQPRLRIRSAHASGPWPYIPRNKSASDNGLLVRAYAGELIRAQASLDELAVAGPDRLELSARAFTYLDDSGRPRRRVLAMYRQVRVGVAGRASRAGSHA